LTAFGLGSGPLFPDDRGYAERMTLHMPSGPTTDKYIAQALQTNVSNYVYDNPAAKMPSRRVYAGASGALRHCVYMPICVYVYLRIAICVSFCIFVCLLYLYVGLYIDVCVYLYMPVYLSGYLLVA
jgi:hypothetical protein